METVEYEDKHKAIAMVLSCIDYRFIDQTIHFIEGDEVLDNKFDFTTLAGASLGYNQTKYKCWKETFLHQVKLSIELHQIKEIIVVDHMDCGAYALFYPHLKSNSEQEREYHIKNIKRFIKSIKKRYPKLTYRGYLLNLDDTVETVV